MKFRVEKLFTFQPNGVMVGNIEAIFHFTARASILHLSAKTPQKKKKKKKKIPKKQATIISINR